MRKTPQKNAKVDKRMSVMMHFVVVFFVEEQGKIMHHAKSHLTHQPTNPNKTPFACYFGVEMGISLSQNYSRLLTKLTFFF
jgi:hypothetical protein